MYRRGILIVDDEEAIRQTAAQALAPLGYDLISAVDGREALDKLEENRIGLVLLDLRMSGLDGLETLRHMAKFRPEVRVILMSGHGTIDSAVEALKLGAVDFIAKPFSALELRDLVLKIIDRQAGEAAQASAYEKHLALTRCCLTEHHLAAAKEHTKQAIGLDPSRPEAFNLFGVLHELTGNRTDALKYYRVALDLDSTYEPALQNLTRPINDPDQWQAINLG
ncbi:MAG: response regulator [Anaerolineae bacterium]|nr:response regulator [Anaerolineae bacterium]